MISSVPRKMLIWLIKTVRPILGGYGSCPYTITCSSYAIIQLEEQPSLIYALWLIIRRLLVCNPISSLFIKSNYSE